TTPPSFRSRILPNTPITAASTPALIPSAVLVPLSLSSWPGQTPDLPVDAVGRYPLPPSTSKFGIANGPRSANRAPHKHRRCPRVFPPPSRSFSLVCVWGSGKRYMEEYGSVFARHRCPRSVICDHLSISPFFRLIALAPREFTFSPHIPSASLDRAPHFFCLNTRSLIPISRPSGTL
ncbi:hypothetical protein C8J57DRAFT_1417170, partial [Mycena rebaudengoi]